MTYKKLIENKRVIFVGPSRILEGTQKGEWIDDFDVVVRTNGAFPVKDYYEIDYGKRCDVLYVNVSFSKMAKPFPVKTYKEKGMSWICFKSQNMTDTESLNYYTQYLKCRSFAHIIQKLNSEVHGLLTGSALLADILDNDPKELWVTGVDYYVNNTHWEWDKCYIDGYLPDETLKQATIKKAQGKLIPHDLKSNLKFQRDLYLNGKIKYDDDVLKILNLYRN